MKQDEAKIFTLIGDRIKQKRIHFNMRQDEAKKIHSNMRQDKAKRIHFNMRHEETKITLIRDRINKKGFTLI